MSKELLDEWTARLGLTDWTIKLEDDCEPDDMALADSVGCTTWEEASRAALIQMLDEKLYGTNRLLPYDYEKTLVHELLHLKLCFVSAGVGDLQERMMHQLIDDLARAFVDAKRNGGVHEKGRRA